MRVAQGKMGLRRNPRPVMFASWFASILGTKGEIDLIG